MQTLFTTPGVTTIPGFSCLIRLIGPQTAQRSSGLSLDILGRGVQVGYKKVTFRLFFFFDPFGAPQRGSRKSLAPNKARAFGQGPKLFDIPHKLDIANGRIFFFLSISLETFFFGKLAKCVTPWGPFCSIPSPEKKNEHETWVRASTSSYIIPIQNQL